MSFASSVKDDLVRVYSQKPCCRLAELLAFIRINGNIRLGLAVSENQGNRLPSGAYYQNSGLSGLGISMTTEHAGSARKIFRLSKDLFQLETKIIVHRKTKLRKNQVFNLQIGPQTGLEKLLDLLGFADREQLWGLEAGQLLASESLIKPCCRRAYLRGAFLASGSVNDPERDYHLEITLNDKEQGSLLQLLLADFMIRAKIVRRKQAFVLYLKDGPNIVNMLNIMGSHRALLDFENTRVVKEVRNQVNRMVNFENANLNKTVDAGMRQCADIRLIERKLGFSGLPAVLRQAAEARMEAPQASLNELSKQMGVGRSALNHRLRRLTEIADGFRG
ncbi:MAG: DNA-binding protein WhiA [Clostridiales bacterium]|nr:DNA-binding protein WhiA [Clostridiales bacterium]